MVRYRFRGLLLAALLTAQGAAQAELYRCKAASGQMLFSNDPCPAGQAPAIPSAPREPAAGKVHLTDPRRALMPDHLFPGLSHEPDWRDEVVDLSSRGGAYYENMLATTAARYRKYGAYYDVTILLFRKAIVRQREMRQEARLDPTLLGIEGLGDIAYVRNSGDSAQLFFLVGNVQVRIDSRDPAFELAEVYASWLADRGRERSAP